MPSPRDPDWSALARHQYAVAAAGIALLLLTVHLPLLLGRAAPMWDARDGFAPYQMLLGDYARSGRLLLWNPFTFAGEPAGIDPELGAFSPMVLLFGVVFGGSRIGFELYWYVAWLLGPLGIVVLGRHLRVPAWGSYIVAAGFGLSGFYTGHAEHTVFLSSLSFLPLILWRLDVALLGHSRLPAAEAGALWGLSALAGYPAIIFLNACFAGAWCVGRVLQQAHRGQSLRHAIVALLIMGGIGLLVLSPAYVALLVEGRGYSHRAGTLPYDVAVTNNALHPLALWTIVNPKLALSDALDYTDISSRSLYMGALIPLLAVFALFRRRDWLRWTLFVTGLLFVAAALGRTLPVRGWLYDFVPLTRYFRHPSMFRAYLIVAMALLALFGASEVAERVNATVKRSLAIALVVIATGDALATASLMRPVMYNPSADSWTRLDAQHVTSVDLSSRGLLRVPDNGNNFTFTPKQPAASGYAAITGPLVREYMSEPVLVDAATSATRLWFTRTAVQSERSSGCLAQLRMAAKRLGAPPLVVHPPEKMENSAGSPTQTCATDFAVLPAAERVPASAVQVIEYTPQRLRLRVHVPDAGWLVVTDSWSRGWTAVINGRAAAIAGGNFLFRAVQVGAGTNSIDFSYRPFGYPWLLALSWGTLAAVAVVTWRQSQTT